MAGGGLREKVYRKVIDLTEYLVSAQGADGAWYYCFESGISTNAYMIILLRHLDIDDRTFIDGLARRIISRQEQGAWKLFYDEPGGNLSATIEAYYALLLSGHRTKDDPEMLLAREFILSRGGIPQSGSLTRAMLALTGQYPWERFPQIPVELVLLPTWAPVNFFDLAGYARVHTAPVMICADKRFVLKISGGPDLSDLYPSSREPFLSSPAPRLLLEEIRKLKYDSPFPVPGESPALGDLERLMLTRTEGDGTLYSYFTATFLMIFSLLALGCERRHPAIVKAVEGLKRMACCVEGHYGGLVHQQETTSTVWDTALISYALQQALMYSHPAVERAAGYLWARQQTKGGDWEIRNHSGHPGGWGFSHSNTINPDVDDTAYALRALWGQAVGKPEACGPAWKAGLEWLLSMQNNDGGWPAFERNSNKRWPELLPLSDALPALTDPSSADITGRALEFLGGYTGLSLPRREVLKGAQWLLNNQRADGSWYGRWGICHIYGTWAAVTGLLAVGLKPGSCVEKAVSWLLSVQSPDGGWGESCLSDSARKYLPLGFSTPSQTAWALDALIAAGLGDSQAVTRGVEALLALVDKNGVETAYPTGQGLPGGFYINYHSYRYVWPLVCFGHYLKGACAKVSGI